MLLLLIRSMFLFPYKIHVGRHQYCDPSRLPRNQPAFTLTSVHKPHKGGMNESFTLNLKKQSKSCFCSEPEALHSSFQIALISQVGGMTVFISNASSLFFLGFLNGNIYHVQGSHREECLPRRLGHTEHDAE